MRMVDQQMKKLGSEIRKRRLQKGMTQKQLAEKLNCSNTYISKIESGVLDPKKEGPSQDFVRRLAENLALEGESVYDLFIHFWIECLEKLPKELEPEIVRAIKEAPKPSNHDLARTRESDSCMSSFNSGQLRVIVERFKHYKSDDP